MSFEFLDKIGKFYFCSGGIGDLLLVLSTMYPHNEEIPPSIIVWANNATASKSFIEAFPSEWFNKKIVFSRWQGKEMFDAIVSHKNFMGKGHIPDRFDFVNEWHSNEDKYLDLINPKFGELLRSTFPASSDIYYEVGLALWGSKEDQWKKKWASPEEFQAITEYILKQYPSGARVFLGSQKDKEENPYHPGPLRWIPYFDQRSNDFKKQFIALNSMGHLYSTDTWQKTWTGLVGIPTTIIRNKYLVPVEQIFPLLRYDPADNIFLNKRFGFTFTTFEELIGQQ